MLVTCGEKLIAPVRLFLTFHQTNDRIIALWPVNVQMWPGSGLWERQKWVKIAFMKLLNNYYM